MAKWHIPKDLLVRFFLVETSRKESRQVVRHLLSPCPRCSDLAQRVTSELGLFAPRQESWERVYEQVFNRVIAFASEEEQRLAVEKLRGWAQWAELEPLAPQLRFVVVESDSRFHNFGLYDRLLEASRWYNHREPAEVVDIVRLAVLVAERLDTSVIGEPRVRDLKAAAWAQLGNARRIAEDFEGARRAFKEAWRLLESGTGDASEKARLISLEASYLKDIGEFEVAESSLQDALEICRRSGDAHQQGRILLHMGEIIGHLHPERGIAHIQRALALIDPTREPRLEICAQHALAWFLSDSGKPETALAVLERARPLYHQFRDGLIQLRLHWLEGKIAFRLGDYAEAENIFGQLWEELQALDLRQEVVLVSLDLAQVLIAKGEMSRAMQLAAESYVIMRDWGLHKDAFRAWLIFQDALSNSRALHGLL